MKLVKSLLLSSAVGLTAVASAQAADLPFRKAAPVEYVRVCDYTGAGYFYIPGTDTCLKVGGYLRADYAYIEPTRAFFSTNSGFVAGPAGGVVAGSYLSGRNRDASGIRAEGRIDADARTQTAYGTLRTYVRFQDDAGGGNFFANPAGVTVGGGGTHNAAYIDKGFIQFAGFTAGRVQSFFDFFADNFNFEGLANSDISTEVFAYTATFGGGFSATVAIEDGSARRDGIVNTTNINGTTGAVYAGQNLPDVVANVRIDQAWGSAQLSGAYHEVRTSENFGNFGSVSNGRDGDGFAVQAGINIKLPTLAAGDNLWLEGAYQNGAYLYMDSSTGLNQGFNALAVGGFIHNDSDGVALRNPNGSYSLALSEGYSVLASFQHYFTPTFSDILYGSYESVSYGRAKNIDWTQGGVGDGSEYRIGNQFLWTPVNNLSIGVEVMYLHVDQTLAHNPGALATALPAGIKKDNDAFEGRLRMERDF